MSGQNRPIFIAGVVMFLFPLFYFFSVRCQCPNTTTATTTTTTSYTHSPPLPSPRTSDTTSPAAAVASTRRLSKDEVKETLTRFGVKINEILRKPDCDLIEFGGGWGRHEACKMEVTENCHFYSFGISNDYSFDTDVVEKTGCTGVGLDPTVTHSSELASQGRLLFFQVGATSLDPLPSEWKVTSVPALKRWLKHDRIFMLKMDCEGCEYAIARDVIAEDPDFFYNVDQFAIEVHISKYWISTEEHLHNYALLIKLLEEAGLYLRGIFLSECGIYESYGCPELFTEINYPCGRKMMCQNAIFARL